MIANGDRLAWVKDEFDRVAINGFLGDPDGRTAMAYLRVSSAGQAEEGRSGFPRQILHVHEKARSLQLAIPWYLVFFDDHTGFEFRDRPNLTRLRELVRTSPRPAEDLVIENLDRLSREATWHQGFLLDELENAYKVRVHFWKELGSTLERVVYGTIAQDRMLTDLERMVEGRRIKARSGRVTAKTPAFGYHFVNSNGGKEHAKKDTHYAIFEPEAGVMRLAYKLLVQERYTLSAICRTFIERGIKPPKNARGWDPSLVRVLLKNTVYKGDFICNRFEEVKGISKRTGRETIKKVERHPSEWIHVQVPALVSVEVWDEAQRVLSDNKAKSPRKAKREYLLLGLTHCAHCEGYKMSSGIRVAKKQTREGPKSYDLTCYRCINKAGVKYIREQRGLLYCPMPQISARRLDAYVWNTVIYVLFDRKRLEAGMEQYFSTQSVESTREEIGYVQTQITALVLEDERLYQAYVAGAFDAEEFARKRHGLKEQRQRIEDTKAELERRFAQQTSKEQRKQQILDSIEELRRQADENTPFELKRRIVLKVIDRITVNTAEEWFELEGAISGRFDFIPAGRGSARRRA